MMPENDIEELLWDWIKSDIRDRFAQGLMYGLIRVLELDKLKMKGGGTTASLLDIRKYLEEKGHT